MDKVNLREKQLQDNQKTNMHCEGVCEIEGCLL